MNIIHSFAEARTEQVWNRQHDRRLGSDLQRMANRKLLILDAAEDLNDLRRPPGNRLERLSGDREGQYGIRINDQWRICFSWTPMGPVDVEIVDYHRTDHRREENTMTTAHAPIHPGEILLEEYLVPLGIGQYRLARAINVPARRINEIVHGKRGISPDTAARLARAFGTTDRFWTNLQTRYDLDIVTEAKIEELDRIVPLLSA